MDNRRLEFLLLLLLHHATVSSFIMTCLLARHYLKTGNRRRRLATRGTGTYNMTHRRIAQISHLHRIIDLGDVECVVNQRVNRNAFARLCDLLTEIGGVRESRNVTREEKVAIFLSTLGHHKKEVLTGVLRLHHILLVEPTPVGDNSVTESWKWFKGCLGALDGTYISVNVSDMDKALGHEKVPQP